MPTCHTMPLIMGIVNCTPDSFFDGGLHGSVEGLVRHALNLARQGADLLDLGGESTRPFAPPVDDEEELERVLPVLIGIRKHSAIPVSIDTTKAIVAEKCLDHGATMINDVSGLLHDPHMCSVVRQYDVPVILMHSRGTPWTMQSLALYDDVVEEVLAELVCRVEGALAAGINPKKIFVDPGFGFAKTAAHNLELLKNLDRFKELRYPLVAGVSRKNFIGHVLHLDAPKDRMVGSLAVHAYLALKGVNTLRVHDVAETVQMLKMNQALYEATESRTL